jgi:DNA adenine methylase
MGEDGMIARPIVKWAGGKTRLLPELMSRVPPRMRTYAEPFAGGAALFFAVASSPAHRFERAILCDQNDELIACYRAVRDDVDALIDALRAYRYDEALFYEVRDRDTRNMSDAERGARLIFLNRTCFNGLWRVNAEGRFNVPFGRYTNPKILDEPALRAASAALQRAELVAGDFAQVTTRCEIGDFVYLDPPYVPISRTASFTSYTSGGFGPRDQERLAREFGALRSRGVRAMLSNHDTPETRALYKDFFFERVLAPRSISRYSAKRQAVAEIIVQTIDDRVRCYHGGRQ